MHFLACGRTDFIIGERVAARADEIALERKRAELEALAKAVRI